VQAALDIAGSGVIPELVAITGDPSRVLSITDLSAPQHGAKTSFEPTNSIKALADAAALFTAGSFTLPVERAFPVRSDCRRARAERARSCHGATRHHERLIAPHDSALLLVRGG
jgi:hypothetical protein